MTYGRRVLRLVTGLVPLLSVIVSAAPASVQEVQHWTIADEPDVEIGRVTGAAPYLFQSVRFARFLADGRIVVGDAGQAAIRIFGPEGDFRQELGGQGEGPGEFRSVDGLWLIPDGRIGVWDAENRRITTFAPDGRLESSNPVRAAGELRAGNLEVFLGSFRDGDVLLATLRGGGLPVGGQVIADRWVIGRFSLDGQLRYSLGAVRGMRRANRQPIPFTPLPYASVHRDSVYLVNGYEAEVAVLDEDGVERRRIDLRPRDAAPGDPWSTLEETLKQQNEDVFLTLLDRMAESEETERVPQLAGLLVDDRGRLWVKRYDPEADALWVKGYALLPAPGGTWCIVRPTGEAVATVQMPERVVPLSIEDGRILGLSRDPLDVQRLVVHSLER